MKFTLSWLRASLYTEVPTPVAVVVSVNGIDRIAMWEYGIPDLRAFFEFDPRSLRQYGFAALDIPDLAGS